MKHFFKQIFLTVAIILSTTIATSQLTAQPAYADCRYILGMPSWDCDVDLESINNEDGLKDAIWNIAFNILSSISAIAIYLAIGYIIYGGYMYISSSGDANKALSGKKTLIQASIGLAIVMSAGIIVNSIRLALGADFRNNCLEAGTCIGTNGVDDMVINTINWFIGIAGVVTLAFVVVGGIGYMLSRGDPAKLQKAKSTIIYALVGLIIVAISFALTNFIYGIISQSVANA